MSKTRVWVVEWNIGCNKNRIWEICSSCEKLSIIDTNFYRAHEKKRAIQKVLQKNYNREWYKNRFRVIEYKSVRS